MEMSCPVVANFDSSELAERAVKALRINGFRTGDMTLLMCTVPSDDCDGATGSCNSVDKTLQDLVLRTHVSNTRNGCTINSAIAVEKFAVPEVGPVLAADSSAFQSRHGVESLGAIDSKVKTSDIDEKPRARFRNQLKGSGALVYVEVSSEYWADKAVRVLKHTGAEEIDAPVCEGDPKRPNAWLGRTMKDLPIGNADCRV